MTAKASPLLGNYSVRNRLANRCLRFVDYFLGACIPARQSKDSIPFPRRILIANGAHLGDVLLATSVLPTLHKAFPGVRVGFLIGSWARPLLRQHPLVEWLHCVDHWKLNRARTSLPAKVCHYQQTRRRALQEIRSRHYDIAIDLYYYFPNSIPLFWQAGIPVRVGYTSGGYGPLLTHAVNWSVRDCHVTDYHAELLRMLPLDERWLGDCRPVLPVPDDTARAAAAEKLGAAEESYVMLHVGTGTPQKEWPLDRWQALAGRLLADGHVLVFTGSTRAEQRNIRVVARGRERCIDLCGRLSWPEFVAVVGGARLVVGVDSVAGHVAAAAETPCVVIGTGIPHPRHWRPHGPLSRVVTHPVPCSPCYRSRGCATMECVRSVEVDQVYRVIQDFFPG